MRYSFEKAILELDAMYLNDMIDMEAYLLQFRLILRLRDARKRRDGKKN